MTTPHADTDELEELLDLDDLFEDIRQTCDDCQHPGCLATVKSAKRVIKAATDEYANQHARKVERHYESLLAKTPRITLGPVKSGLGPYTCDSQHQDQLSQQDKKE